jgi:parallel beta-helix repeat protein
MRAIVLAVSGGLAALGMPGEAIAAGAIVVHPGQSIQAAVDQASPGTRILVEPGTYTEAGRPCPTNPAGMCAIVIAKDGISLIGLSRRRRPVILENPGGQDTGIAVGKTGDPACLGDPTQRIDGSLVRGLTVNDFAGDGISLFCVDHWRVTEVSANADAEYGIFPSHSGPGRVDHSFASGANDTGIYVGQSHDVRIDHDAATGNVSGFEIENSTGVRADHNVATGNTGGILSFILPFLDVKTNSDNLIDHNLVEDNNKPNTCSPGDDVCAVPVGTGILLVAADQNVVDHNSVSGNDSFGVLVANFCVAFKLTPAECAGLDIEPNPDGNHVEHNTVTGNGASPDPSIAPFPGADLLWDTTGTGNCWEKNVADTTFPDPLPACG